MHGGERNRKLYSHTYETSLQLPKHIKEVIRFKLTGMQSAAADSVNKQLCINWGLSILLT